MVSIKEKLQLLDNIAQRRPLKQFDYINCQLSGNTQLKQKSYFKTKKALFPPIPRRFDDLQVKAIRSLANSGFSHAQLANLFATCKATIWHITTYKGAYVNVGRN